MKQVFFVLLFSLFYATSALTQAEAFTLTAAHTGLDADQNKVVAYVSSLPRNGSVKYLNWDAQTLVDNNGIISVTLPGENGGGPINFKLLEADYASTTEYALYGKGDLGNIALYITPQGIGGTIDLFTKVYAMFPLGGIKGTLIELVRTETETEAVGCGTTTNTEEKVNYCEEDCGRATLDILALVTPGARQWANNNWGWLGAWFLFSETHNINGAFVNSLIPNKRVRVKIVDYTPDFNPTQNIGNDLNLLRNSLNAQQLALQNGSDIRILLTEINYPNIAGAIPNDQGDPLGTNKVGIVEVPSIGPVRFTFAHEVAHHFGCWHSIPTIPGCPNGMFMANMRNTIMGNESGIQGILGALDFSRIQHFSNPDVDFGGFPTGVAGIRNNAAQIRGAFCEVADNLPEQYSVLISKNTLGPICVGETHTFGANIVEGICEDPFTLSYNSCATGPYQYEWRVSNSPDFSNSQVIGTTQTVTFTVQHCPLYLRVTAVSANGLTTTSTKSFICQGVVCDGLIQNPPEYSPTTDTDENWPNIRCFPNPANDRLKVLFKTGATVKLSIIDIAGRIISNHTYSGDKGEIMLNVSDLEPGLWFLRIQRLQEEQTIKFSIIR